MQKFFIEEKQKEDNIIKIIGDDVKHISNVLRMKIGEKVHIGVFNTKENYIAEIKEINKEKIILDIIEKLDISSESDIEIDLYQGLPKADKMELIIQKTIEIGVKKIIPVSMKRCVVKLDEKDSKKKIERWNKIAESAAKQSKRDIIPEVENIIQIDEIYNEINNYDIFIVAYEEENNLKLKDVIKNTNYKKIGVLIGPEGGIDEKEIELLKNNNAKIITLGKRILRTETAPIVTISNILYELEK